jgi:hypothetical protein
MIISVLQMKKLRHMHVNSLHNVDQMASHHTVVQSWGLDQATWLYKDLALEGSGSLCIATS